MNEVIERSEVSPERKLTLSLRNRMSIVDICVGNSAYKALLLLAVVPPVWPAAAPTDSVPATVFRDDDAVAREGAKA